MNKNLPLFVHGNMCLWGTVLEGVQCIALEWGYTVP